MPDSGPDPAQIAMIRDAIIAEHPYSRDDGQKAGSLLPVIRQQLTIARRSNPVIDEYFRKLGIEVGALKSLEDVPSIPVQMFKLFDLRTCPEDAVVRVLQSSGTTGSMPSRIPLDKSTTLNQIRALKSILADYMGNNRRIFLVIDHEGINAPAHAFSARTAGVRGLSIYAKKTFYLLREVDGRLVLNMPVIREIIEKYSNEDVYAFGFTYIIWTVFCEQIRRENIRFSFRKFILFHGGGWKKMEQLAVSKETFSESVASVFGAESRSVLDFYGMAEQTGIIFVDCPEGNKHVPGFSHVIIRDPFTLEPCGIGRPGFIEVMSVLAESYYGQAVLTEDLGVLIGIDDCPCGRKGRYFRFLSRVEKAEMRGCGDTFRE